MFLVRCAGCTNAITNFCSVDKVHYWCCLQLWRLKFWWSQIRYSGCDSRLYLHVILSSDWCLLLANVWVDGAVRRKALWPLQPKDFAGNHGIPVELYILWQHARIWLLDACHHADAVRVFQCIFNTYLLLADSRLLPTLEAYVCKCLFHCCIVFGHRSLGCEQYLGRQDRMAFYLWHLWHIWPHSRPSSLTFCARARTWSIRTQKARGRRPNNSLNSAVTHKIDCLHCFPFDQCRAQDSIREPMH